MINGIKRTLPAVIGKPVESNSALASVVPPVASVAIAKGVVVPCSNAFRNWLGKSSYWGVVSAIGANAKIVLLYFFRSSFIALKAFKSLMPRSFSAPLATFSTPACNTVAFAPC